MTPYEEGYEAGYLYCRDGTDMENPFARNTKAYDEWERGFEDGMRAVGCS